MTRWLVNPLKLWTRKLDYRLVRRSRSWVDFEPEDMDTIRRVKPYTMTSEERLYALIQSVKYVVRHRIPGDIVECGVWKGGSMMAVAQTLLKLDRTDRQLYLFDTFDGMTQPTHKDVTFKGEKAEEKFAEKRASPEGSRWCYAQLDDVKRALLGTGYDASRMHFVQGRVEATIPAHAPEVISLLRLDTDWYESTRHELAHLFPRLTRGGVIILDDYGHWLGARQATDEYIAETKTCLLLNRIDYSGRIGVKV